MVRKVGSSQKCSFKLLNMVKRSEILPEILRKALSKLNPDHEQTQTSTLSAKSGKKEQFLQLKLTKTKKTWKFYLYKQL